MATRSKKKRRAEAESGQSGGAYGRIIAQIFAKHRPGGETEFEFERAEIAELAQSLDVSVPKNLGDVLYSTRYRAGLPDECTRGLPRGKEWIVVPAGPGRYRCVQARCSRIRPRRDMGEIKVPDATPGIVTRYALSDEQATLAKIRYNRLVDTFLGVTAYSLQNHVRTSIVVGQEVEDGKRKDLRSQIELDEVYVGVVKSGAQYVIPVEAKGRMDFIGAVQMWQNARWAEQKHASLGARIVAAQSLSGQIIAMLELDVDGYDVTVLDEKHYRLVPQEEISTQELKGYLSRTP